MPTVTKYVDHINFQYNNNQEYGLERSANLSGGETPNYVSLFMQNCFDIPKNSTINSVKVCLEGRQSRSNTSLYQSQWRLNRFDIIKNWNGYYGSLNEFNNLINSGAIQMENKLTSTMNSGNLNDSWKSIEFNVSSQHNFTVDELQSGIRTGLRIYYKGTLGVNVYIRNLRIVVDYTPPPMYYLDLNCYINGSHAGDISTVGTANVYINGSLVSKNCTDYYTQHYVGTTYKIDVTANTGWKISGFNTNPVSFSGTINGTTNVEPEFSKIRCNVSVSGNGGTVTGGGTYDYGSSVTLTATPNAGYQFVRWSDGNTSQTRTLTVTSDITLTAIFEAVQTKPEFTHATFLKPKI